MTDPGRTPDWVQDAVFYQVFPDRFAMSERVARPGPLEPWDASPTHHGFKGGDLLGIVERLDHIAGLGANALYLTPIFASASNHRYHTCDYYRVDPLLGGDEALRELLDACHARDMRVVLDGVFNHAGRGFWPFHHVVENGAGSPYVDWFHLDHERLAAGNRLRPYPTSHERRAMEAEAGSPEHRRGDASLRHLGYRAWCDLPALPKLNTDNRHMREHLLGAAEHWLRFGIDGWRLDVAEEIDAGFWREFRQRVRAVNPEAYIVAEIWREKPEWLTGDTFDALMNYPLTEALISFTAGRHLDQAVVAAQHEYRDFVRPLDGPAFAERLEHIVTMYRPEAVAAQLNLLGSHDTPRYLTVCGGDRRSLMLATLAQMTLPGAPCIYYGDEVGLRGSHDPDCRRAFPWREEAWDTELLEFVRRVTRQRRTTAALRRGTYRTLAAGGAAVVYGRFGPADGDRAIIALNAGEEAVELEFALPSAADEWQSIDLPAMARPTVEQAGDGDSGRLRLAVARRTGAILLPR